MGLPIENLRSCDMESAIEGLKAKGRAAKAASRKLAYLSAEVKNKLYIILLMTC